MLAQGDDPRLVSRALEHFRLVTMIVELAGTDLGKPLSLTMDFTLTLADSSAQDKTLNIAMGSLQFRPDTRRNIVGWPLELRLGRFGEVTGLTTLGYNTDTAAMEKTFGHFVRLMFVPIPQEPIGIGARWLEEETVGDIDEATIFDLVERTPTALTVRVSKRLQTPGESSSGAGWNKAKLEGTLEVPIAPWQPARGGFMFEAEGREGGLSAHVTLRER